ncbi:MAG: hypothetical protein GY953_24405 [bacterium]|nr:hypothetical protein [bacterium]
MSKRWIWMVGLVCCTAMAGIALADWDPAAVAGMSKADRMAYQQSYKASLESAARDGGWNGKRAFNGVGREAAAPPKGIGAIVYDSGALGVCCQSSFCVGNQFDSAINPLGGGGIEPVEMSGSVTMVTFDMIGVGGTAAFLSFFDQVAGTTANGVSSFSTPVVTGFNQKDVNVPYAGTSFLAGVWQFGGDSPAVATGTVGWQGHHGMSINDISATGFTRPGTYNAVFRVTGDVLTPVELLNFDVE